MNFPAPSVAVHLICPICAAPLSDEREVFTCGRGHAFDRAREGYVDLLPQGYGRASIAGDRAEMVAARRRFLAAGHYGRLLDRVTARVREHVDIRDGPREHVDMRDGPREDVEMHDGPRQPVDMRDGPREHVDMRDGPRGDVEMHDGPREQVDVHDGPREHVDMRDGPREHVDMHDGPRQHVDMRNGPREHVDMHDGPREHVDTHDGPRQPVDTHDGPRQPVDVRDGPRQHVAAMRDGPREQRGSASHAPGGPVVLDVGCGDGYYGGGVAEALGGEHGACRLYGLDISRAALKVAARAWRAGVFFRNDIAFRICVEDGAVDVLLDIFAPRNADEFARVLRPGGLAVVVIPDESHLHELRETLPLLSIEPEKRQRVTAQFASQFTLQDESAVTYRIPLTRPGLEDLIAMSPSAHHVEESQLDSLRAMDVTAAFRVLTFRRASEFAMRSHGVTRAPGA